MRLSILWCLAVALLSPCHASHNQINNFHHNENHNVHIRQASDPLSSTASHHRHVSHASSTTPTGTTTTPTTAKAPTVTLGAYSIYWWDCQRSTTTSTSGSTGSTGTYSNANGAFRVGLARAGACGSRDNTVQQIPAGSGSGGGGQQQTYAICGGARTLGGSYYYFHGGGGMGSCNPILETDGACCSDVGWDALVSCVDADGSTECKVQRVARCDDVCVGSAEVVTVDNAASATGTAGR